MRFLSTFDKSLYSLATKHIHQKTEMHRHCSIVFCMYACGHVHLLYEPPTHSFLSVCLPGKCMQRLSVWMLLLPIILAPDLQRAEEESGIPRLLVFFLSQIHSSGLPAGGALGLAGTGWPPELLAKRTEDTSQMVTNPKKRRNLIAWFSKPN